MFVYIFIFSCLDCYYTCIITLYGKYILNICMLSVCRHLSFLFYFLKDFLVSG